MSFKLILAVSLAVFAMPVAGHAALPGEACTEAQVGSTVKAEDNKNIIACLLNDEGAYVWKAMTSGGGGITGGCRMMLTSSGYIMAYWDAWGKGCLNSRGATVEERQQSGNPALQFLGGGPESGYSCGVTSDVINSKDHYLNCVKSE